MQTQSPRQVLLRSSLGGQVNGFSVSQEMKGGRNEDRSANTAFAQTVMRKKITSMREGINKLI